MVEDKEAGTPMTAAEEIYIQAEDTARDIGTANKHDDG